MRATPRLQFHKALYYADSGIAKGHGPWHLLIEQANLPSINCRWLERHLQSELSWNSKFAGFPLHLCAALTPYPNF